MTVTIGKFGAGVETTGLVCGWHERGIRPDALVMADTGGELDETMENVDAVDALIQSWGWDPIVRVSEAKTLEQHSLDTQRMPSVSYGRKSCSIRFKVEPFERWVKTWAPAVDAWGRGERVTVVIGYNVDEVARWSKAQPPDPRFAYRYDLVEWKWGREDAAAAARRFGLNPCKSACFFCGSARPLEVLRLRDRRPDLFARGVVIERAARPFRGSIRGLGKNFSWEEIADADDRQMRMLEAQTAEEPIDCECHEGGVDDGDPA